MQLIISHCAHLGSRFSQLDRQTDVFGSLQRTSSVPSSLGLHRTQIADFTVCRPLPLVRVAAVGKDNPGELFGGTIPWKLSNRGTKTNHRKSFAPLELQSSEGQALMTMLQNHENLSRVASQQLELLAAEWQLTRTHDRERKSGDEDYLYRRITFIKQKERSRVLQDIMYALVVERMVDGDLTMALPMESTRVCERKMGFASEEHKKLEALHPPEARELIREFVAMVIGGRNATIRSFDPDAFTRISKLTMGKIYAASAMYGYFLKRIHQRFKLDEQLSSIQLPTQRREGEMKAYVRSMDAATQQRHGRVKVEASVQMIERHVEALFGKPEVMLMGRAKVGSNTTLHYSNNSDLSMLHVQLGAIKTLLLEALALGSVLWDVEVFLVSSYPLSSVIDD